MTIIGSSIGPSEEQDGQTPGSLFGPWVNDKSPVKAGFDPAAPGDTDVIRIVGRFTFDGNAPTQTILLKRGSVTLATVTFEPLESVDFSIVFEVRYESCGVAGVVRVAFVMTGDNIAQVECGEPVTVNTTNDDEYDVTCVSNEDNHITVGKVSSISVG